MQLKKTTYVDDEIARAVRTLAALQADSEEYTRALEHLTKLQKIRQEEKPDRPSSDTMLNAGVNLLGMLMVVNHEHLGVITTKALGLVLRTR